MNRQKGKRYGAFPTWWKISFASFKNHKSISEKNQKLLKLQGKETVSERKIDKIKMKKITSLSGFLLFVILKTIQAQQNMI